MAVVTHGSFDEGPVVLALPDYFEGIWSALETDPIFSAWDKSTGISITQSQISDGSTIVNTGDLTTISIDTSGTIEASNISGSNTGDQDLSGLVPYTGGTEDVNLTDNFLTIKQITVTDSPVNDRDVVTKAYVDELFTMGTIWAESVKDITATLPGTPSNGDRYILSTTKQINEYTTDGGGMWVATTPTAGTTLYVEENTLAPSNNVGLYTFNGLNWVYSGGTSVTHNSLSDLQGGQGSPAQYYHLTSAQRTIAIQTATTDRDGYLTSTDWDTFNDKVSKSGSPLDTYLAVWTDANTITGTDGITYDGTDFIVTGNIRATGEVSAYDIGAPIDWWDAMPDVTTLPVGDVGGIKLTGDDTKCLLGDGTWGVVSSGSSITPAALTKVDDTNVTLTLGGSPGTALLQATTLTLGWTGLLDDLRIKSASTWNAKASTAGPTFSGNVDFVQYPGSPINIRITSDGKIGIGTTSPTAPLSFGTGYNPGSITNETATNKIKLYDSGLNSNYGLGVSTGKMTFGVPSSYTFGFYVDSTEVLGVSSSGITASNFTGSVTGNLNLGSFTLTTSGNNLVINYNGSPIFYISSAGNVAAKQDIVGYYTM